MKKRRIISLIFMALLCMSFCTSCEENSQKNKAFSDEIFAMDTYMTMTAYGENGEQAVREAKEKIKELDDLLSTEKKDSEIGKLNAQGEGVLGAEVQVLLKEALRISEETEGAFDPTIYPLMCCWGFPSGEFHVPSAREMEDMLSLVGYEEVFMEEETGKVSFGKKGMMVDLGGIAKGYTSSKIMDIYQENGVTSGIVSLGGNIQVLGTKPDGSYWKIGVQDPLKEEDYLGVLSIKNAAVVTSGGYERFFEEDGITYHHILDPKTGMTANHGLISVTIISENGALADGLSTALFVMGTEKAVEFWKNHREEFQMILYTEEKKMLISDGIFDDFSTDKKAEKIGN